MVKYFVYSVVWIGFIAAGNACAQTDLGTHTLKISAQLLTPNCSLEFPGGDSANLGTLSPSQIANAPAATDALALTYIRANSAHGELRSSYLSGTTPIILRISCKDKLGQNIFPGYWRYSLTFGDTAQMLTGNLPGAASAGYGYKLNTGGTTMRQNLAFMIHVKDLLGAAHGGKNALIKPGENTPLDERSFTLNNTNDARIADFEISPGVFWVNSDKSTEGGKFDTELIVTLKFN